MLPVIFRVLHDIKKVAYTVGFQGKTGVENWDKLIIWRLMSVYDGIKMPRHMT